MKAVVYKSTGSWYRVKTENKDFKDARIRGRFKTEDITSTNPVAVGDEVTISKEGSGDFMITDIAPRKNYIIRQSPQNKNLQHIIAANLDQAVLMASLRNPRTSTGFIDRFLVACEAFHVPAVLVFNKSDLYREKDIKEFQRLKTLYESMNYTVISTSLQTQSGLEDFEKALKGKRSLVSGHSGVGKSSIINFVLPDLEIKTQDVSGWSGKGMHTTTFAEMYDLPFGGSVIDTPGMREFAVLEVTPVELSHYFAEMRPLIGGCRFNNCLHTEEPDCAIKEGVAAGSIDAGRYISYLNILSSIEEKKW